MPWPSVSVASSLLQACTHACVLLGHHKAQGLPLGFSRAYQAWRTGKHLASQRSCLSPELLIGLRHLVWQLLIQVFPSPVPQLSPSIRCCPDPACSAILFWDFLKSWKKEPFPSTVSWAKNCSIFPFLLYDSLFLFLPCSCNCCLICVRRGLVSPLRGDTEVCRY